MKKLLTSVVAVGMILSATYATDVKTDNVSKNAVIKAKQKATNIQSVKEAVRAVQYTTDALLYLSNKKIDKAKETLKKAIGELAVVLNSPNAPYLLPIETRINAYQFTGDVKTIKKSIKKVENLIKDNKIPQARSILNSLRSEIVIKTVNLPLATYPAALNLSIKYINENKIKEAKEVLTMAISTLVEVDNIIPIPLIKAEALSVEASKIIKKDKKQALKYLNEAKYQLIIAEALGYTSTSDTSYKMLKSEITKLEKEINKGHKTASIFEDLIKKLKEFKEKAINVIHK